MFGDMLGFFKTSFTTKAGNCCFLGNFWKNRSTFYSNISHISRDSPDAEDDLVEHVAQGVRDERVHLVRTDSGFECGSVFDLWKDLIASNPSPRCSKPEQIFRPIIGIIGCFE